MPEALRQRPAPRALVIEDDPALGDLLEEWLGESGFEVERNADPRIQRGRFDFIVTDVPDLRLRGARTLVPLCAAHPGTPILALSSSFLAGVEMDATVARWLGVAGVLPKPVTREALLLAVDRMLARPV